MCLNYHKHMKKPRWYFRVRQALSFIKYAFSWHFGSPSSGRWCKETCRNNCHQVLDGRFSRRYMTWLLLSILSRKSHFKQHFGGDFLYKLQFGVASYDFARTVSLEDLQLSITAISHGEGSTGGVHFSTSRTKFCTLALASDMGRLPWTEAAWCGKNPQQPHHPRIKQSIPGLVTNI